MNSQFLKYLKPNAMALNYLRVPPVYTDEIPSHYDPKVHKLVGTHSGKFHCDEALASAILHLLPEFESSIIVRSRNPQIWEKCDVLVDVGAVFDVEKKRFDHHQIEFQGTFSDDHKTRLSSAGLIYKYYGKEVLSKVFKLEDDIVELLYVKIYDNFMEMIDAVDNGIDISDAPLKYKMSTTLSQRVGNLNPSWNNTEDSDESTRFQAAVHLTGLEFLDLLLNYIHGWLPARKIVEKSFLDAPKVHEEIMILESFCPWESHLFQLEKEHGKEGQIKYIIFSDTSGQWRVRAVSKESGSFALRKPLPWKGIRGEELSKLSGVPGCVFIHASGFIGGNKTFEGALEMAKLALNHQE